MPEQAEVLFIGARVADNRGMVQRFPTLLDRLGFDFVDEGDEVAVKVHFGDDGTTAFVRPQFSRKIVDKLKARGAHPFLTDTCVLEPGRRQQAVSHLELALENGFSYATVAAPLVIADGIRSRDAVTVPVNGRHFDEVRYASAVHHADALVVLSHVKGHLATGMGGTMKNLSMGLGSRAMKQAMHADVKPTLNEDRCEACADCVDVCPTDAVAVTEGIARFDLDRCIGCAECITVCQPGALQIQWNERPHLIQEKMAEVAAGALAAKRGKAAFINVVVEVTPDCDCFPWSDNPMVNNVGILASFDPVAIDQAAADLINRQPGLPDSRLSEAGRKPGADKFADLYPDIDWTRQLVHAEAMGLGTRNYTLVPVDA